MFLLLVEELWTILWCHDDVQASKAKNALTLYNTLDRAQKKEFIKHYLGAGGAKNKTLSFTMKYRAT